MDKSFDLNLVVFNKFKETAVYCSADDKGFVYADDGQPLMTVRAHTTAFPGGLPRTIKMDMAVTGVIPADFPQQE